MCALGTPHAPGDSRCIRVRAVSPRSVEGRGAVPGRRDARIHCASMAVRIVLVLDAIDISIPSSVFIPPSTVTRDCRLRVSVCAQRGASTTPGISTSNAQLLSIPIRTCVVPWVATIPDCLARADRTNLAAPASPTYQYKMPFPPAAVCAEPSRAPNKPNWNRVQYHHHRQPEPQTEY